MTSKKKRVLIVSMLSVLLALIALVTIFTNINTQVQQYDEVLASNVLINNISVGGLTPEEAKAELQSTLVPTLGEREIKLVPEKGDTSITFTYNDLGVTYNLDEVIEEAALIGHEGSFWERYELAKKPPTTPVHLTLIPNFDEKQLVDYVSSHMDTFYVAPIDAKMERKNRTFHITSEVYGHKADVDSTTSQIIALVSKDQVGEVTVPLLSVRPTYTSTDLQSFQTPLASFNTSYNNNDLKRNMNVELAAQKINTMLMPGEKFMYSKQLEPITLDAGYQMAKVIINGNFDEGIGGGICQVSSTLYNAVLLTDLDIYMRRNHSLPVSYTPLGRDATYATNSVDFQFINNTGYPIYVEGYCENNKVYVNLYGHESAKPTYESKFESEIIEVIEPPATRYVEDETLAPGTEVTKVYPKKGHKVVLYKLFYKNGELIKKEKINTSTYKAQGQVIHRGPQLPTNPVTPPEDNTQN